MTSQIFTLKLKTPTSILIYFDDSKYKPQIDRGLFLDLHVSFLLVSLFVLFLSDAPNSFPKPAPPKKTCVYIYTCCFINIYIYIISFHLYTQCVCIGISIWNVSVRMKHSKTCTWFCRIWLISLYSCP